MTKRASTPDVRLAVTLAVAVLLSLLVSAASAAAYDPATDQYAPSTPSGGGALPVNGGNSVSGEGSAPTSAPAAAAAPVAPQDSASADAATGSPGDSRDETTLRDFAVQAQQQRDALTAPGGRAQGASGDQGMGVLLPIVLGLMLLSAVGAHFLRRREGGHPA